MITWFSFRFTPKEDHFILENVGNFKKPFNEIGKILNRHPHSILKRYNILCQGMLALCSCSEVYISSFFKENITIPLA